MPAAIAVERASKVFIDGAVVAFHDLSLDVRDRETVSIVGPSGCGKTTLLRSIAGLIPLSDGTIRIFGETVTGPPKDVAMVFQHFGLLPWKTVLENAGFGLAMAHAPRERTGERVGHYLDLVGLTGSESRYPYQLSGGMQQRVGLVRALAMDPKILLMDEPFASLDAQTRETLQEELLRIMALPAERKTVVFVTHSIDEALLVGDRVIVTTGRPARVREIVSVPFGWPRDPSAIRADARFAELREHIWSQLRPEAATAMAIA